jgi:hypothetical protein
VKVPNKSELMHLQIQAAMREYVFTEDQMKYLGFENDEHWYLIDNEHKVSASQLESFEIVE